MNFKKIEHSVISWFYHVVIIITLLIFDDLLTFTFFCSNNYFFQRCKLKVMKQKETERKKGNIKETLHTSISSRKIGFLTFLIFITFKILVTFKSFAKISLGYL